MCIYQFEDGNYCQRTNYQKYDFCILHFPFPENKNSEDWEYLDKIKQEQFFHQYFIGVKNFEGCIFGIFNCTYRVLEDFIFKNCIFLGNVYFSHTFFVNYVDFSNTKFSENTYFESTNFPNKTDFTNSYFSKYTTFNKSFFSFTEFKLTKFIESVNFNKCFFYQDVDFFKVKFSKSANFLNVTFLEEVSFQSVIFKGETTFLNAEFKGTSYFFEAKFKQIVNFDAANFCYADFRNCIFYMRANFRGTTFSSRADFSKIKFLGVSDFLAAKFYSADFDFVSFNGISDFHYITINSQFNCRYSTFNESVILDEMKILGSICFFKTFFIYGFNITKPQFFQNQNTTIMNFDQIVTEGNITFYEWIFPKNKHLSLVGTQIVGDFLIDQSAFYGSLDVNNLKVTGNIKIDLNKVSIINSFSKNNLFRNLKTYAQELGDKEISDNYFYHEKAAMHEIQHINLRKDLLLFYSEIKEICFSKKGFKQNKDLFKPKIIKTIIQKICNTFNYFLEYPIHYYFFYGVKPILTFIFCFVIITLFALFFWYNKMLDNQSILSAFYFSITNAMTPGYGKNNPIGNFAILIACIEAIFGAFTWGCFLAIFARKYMDK